MNTVIIRLVAYASLPLIVGIAKKGTLDIKKNTVIATVWALLVSAVIAALFEFTDMAEAIGFIIGGTISGAIVGDIVLSIVNGIMKKASNSNDEKDEEIIIESSEEAGVEPLEQSGQSSEEDNTTDHVNESGSSPTEKTEAEDTQKEVEVADSDVGKLQEEADHTESDEDEVVEKDIIPENELRQLKNLHDAGVIDDKEFKEKKRKLLNL